MALVQSDARDPGPEWPCAIVSGECGEGGEETLLRDVERGICIAGVAPDQAIYAVAMAAHEFGIGSLPPRDGQCGKLAVRAAPKIERHCSLAVSALTTAASNLAA